jgi:hypothetical protein
MIVATEELGGVFANDKNHSMPQTVKPNIEETPHELDQPYSMKKKEEIAGPNKITRSLMISFSSDE